MHRRWILKKMSGFFMKNKAYRRIAIMIGLILFFGLWTWSLDKCVEYQGAKLVNQILTREEIVED